MTHSCQYCNGMLMSTRPMCEKCGHALNATVYTVSEYEKKFLFFDVKVKTIQYSYCPKCQTKNIIGIKDHAATI